jgi:SAM-dependent methyltransferase
LSFYGQAVASAPEQPPPALSVFDDAYATRTAPWVIGQPQPAIVTLERKGWVGGKVLDVGCGTEKHTTYLSALCHDVYGLDSSPRAVEQARANAAARNVEVPFQVADALAPGDDTTYGTVIDSALAPCTV